MEVESCELDDD